MKHALSISLASLAVVVALPQQAALAADDQAKPSSCAFVRTINGWTAVDDQTAIIETSPRRKFKVTFATPCRELKWAHFARIDPRPSSAVCLSAGDVLVFGRGAAFPTGRWEHEERCMIHTIEPLPLDGPKDAPPPN